MGYLENQAGLKDKDGTKPQNVLQLPNDWDQISQGCADVFLFTGFQLVHRLVFKRLEDELAFWYRPLQQPPGDLYGHLGMDFIQRSPASLLFQQYE